MKTFNLNYVSLICVLIFTGCSGNSGTNSGYGSQVSEFLKSDKQKEKEEAERKWEEERKERERIENDKNNEAACKFEIAQKTVKDYVEEKRFKIIETYNPDYMYGAFDYSRGEFHCSVTYKFLVKEPLPISFTEQPVYKDPLYVLTVTLTKFKNVYEITSSTLINKNTGMGRRLI